MKKYVFGVLFLASVGIGIVGCKKEIFTNPAESVIKSNNAAISFEKKEGVLVFQNWDDIVKLEESFEDLMNTHIELFETENAITLRDLRITVDGTTYDMSNPESELTWESELAVDSFEMVIGWSEFQPLIDFEIDNGFNSLRKKHFDILYGDSEDERPSILNDEERLYFLTYPISGAMATLFNEDAIIGVGDTVYKVLGNNVWISCLFENLEQLKPLNEENYTSIIGRDGFKVYDIDKEKSGCYANTKRWDDATTSDQKYRVLGMMTVTNVALPFCRYVKGRTTAEIKNKKGKWKSRKTFVRVHGGAQLFTGSNPCDQDTGNPRTLNDQHNNKSKAKDTEYSDVWMRVKSGFFMTLHEGGSGSNKLTFVITLI